MQIQTNPAAAKLAVLIATSLAFASPNFANAANKVKTIAVLNGGQPVAAKTDSEGTIHLLFQSADEPQYAKSTDNGKTFSKPIPVVRRDSRNPDLKFLAWDLAVGQGGRIHVALATNAWALKLPQEEWGFYYAHLDAGSGAFSPVQNINLKSSEGFSLAADDKGNVTACWLSGKLYANVSRDNGKTFGPAVEIDPAINPCDCCTTSSVYGADGKLAVLYREETNNERDMYLVLWDQDRNESTRTRVSTTLWTIEGCPMTYFSVNRNQDGYIAVWPTKGQVYLARMDSKGTLQPPTEIKAPGTTGMRVGILALSGANGATLVAWKQLGQLKWQLYDNQGQSLGSPGSAESAGAGVAGVVDKYGEFIVFR